MADGIILGEQVYKKMTSAWLEAAHVVFELDGDKEALQEFRYAFGRNPAHIKKAVQRFPELWGEDAPDLFQLLASIQLSKIKDDETAQAIFSDWVGNTDAGLDTLKELIADHTDKRERGASVKTMWALRNRNLDGTVTPMNLDRVWAIYGSREDAKIYGNGIEPIEVDVTYKLARRKAAK